MQRMSGLCVGAVIGTVFIFLSVDESLSSPLAIVLRVLAAVTLAGVVVMWLLGVKVAQSGGTLKAAPNTAESFFGRRYALVVATEAALLFIGLTVLRSWGLPEQVNIAWLAFVAGVHFIALVPVWGERGLLIPGMVLIMIGVAGFALAATTALKWVPVASGVLSGITILAGSTAYSWRTLTSMR
ncbi:hypothetical protein ACIBI7_21675 [Nonomuraea fuscirosea]|uniref:hypothetical protein n=1 Tax=Nonomuraea fuscirosea TaxID=1291556 RepID=UPI0037A826B2